MLDDTHEDLDLNSPFTIGDIVFKNFTCDFSLMAFVPKPMCVPLGKSQ